MSSMLTFLFLTIFAAAAGGAAHLAASAWSAATTRRLGVATVPAAPAPRRRTEVG